MSSPTTIVTELYSVFEQLLEIIPASEVSLKSVASDTFRKNLLLSAASLFEKDLTATLRDLVCDWGSNTELLNEFVRIRALEQKYHTMFDWKKNTANYFFGMFGSDFKAHMESQCKADDDLVRSIAAFMEIGRERNRLVHQDFGNYSLEKTTDEIYELYLSGRKFTDDLTRQFQTFLDDPTSAEPDAE